jgi:DNA-binding XRE family transcriptional regulator
MSRHRGESALEWLGSVTGDSDEVRRAARRERLRLELARYMRKAREKAGLTQAEVATRLGVKQAWISKLENSNYDHKLESVLTYFDAIGAEMDLRVRLGTAEYAIWE